MKFKGFLANSFIIFFSLVLVLFFLEIICRMLVDFDSGYYSSSKINKNKSFITHPYGKIPINEYGFFDEKFNFDKNKEVIAYFGDSVTYGVGAGYPYRFTEYLDNINSKFEHINLSGGIGTSLNEWNFENEKFLLKNNIRRIVYVMNLNDIAPLSQQIVRNDKNLKNLKDISFIKNLIRPLDNIFRGKSELYTFVRFVVKKQIVKAGYEASGYESIELFSKKNSKHIVNASKKIDEWLEKTKKKGFNSCVVILPYEMQISKNAENYYRSINIKFEKSFVNFSTQNLIRISLRNHRKLFIIDDNGFEQKKIGHYYVFDKGDKIDFNHPNREGHLVIAKEINKKNVCQN